MYRTLVCVGLLLLVGSTAWAQVPVSYDAFSLAEGRIGLPDTLEEMPIEEGVQLQGQVEGAGACLFRIEDGALIQGDECAAMWSQKTLRLLQIAFPIDEENTLTLILSPPRVNRDNPDRFFVRDGAIDPAGRLPEGEEIAIFAGGQWQILTVNSVGLVPLSAELAKAAQSETLTAFTYRGSGGTDYHQWRLMADEGGSATGPGDKETDADSKDKKIDKTKGFCTRFRKRFPDRYVICIDAEEREPVVRQPTRGAILKPNTSLVVVVRHRSEHTFQMEVDGERGLAIPGVKASGDGEVTRGDKGNEEEIETFIVRHRELVPRRPGAVDIQVVILEEGGEVFSTAQIELLIEKTYSSALRIGVAGILLGAVDRQFEAQVQPGSEQGEIVAVGSGDFDLELVAAFVPFLERGGRSYSKDSLARFAPYLGIGVLSRGADGEVEFFKSVHLGVEWELSPTFSVAVTGVLRRVDRLAPGHIIGGPVGGDVPTVQRQSLGLGIVLNVSPEFLSFSKDAAGGGLF